MKLMMIGLLATATLLTTACEERPRTTGEKVEDAIDKAGDKVEKATDKVGDAVGKAVDKTEDAAKKVKKEIEK